MPLFCVSRGLPTQSWCAGSSIDRILKYQSSPTFSGLAGQLPIVANTPVSQSMYLYTRAIRYDAAVTTMSFSDGTKLLLMPPPFTYICGKLNNEKLTRIPPEVKVQATSDPSLENIRLTAVRLKESPLQITSRPSPRTGRCYIVVGEVRDILTPPKLLVDSQEGGS